MTPYIVIFTTAETAEDAGRIAEHLVERGLAACVQVSGPIKSVYRWKGEVEKADEWLCSVKTAGELYGEAEQAIREVHPYEVPEIVALPIEKGSPDYLLWLGEQLKR